MLPDEPTDEERQEELPQDNGTPFQPAAPSADPGSGVTTDPMTQAASDSTLDDTHPATDTNIQPEEHYDEGTSGAAEAQEPSTASPVAGYTPPVNGDTPAADSEGATPDEPIAPSGDDITVG